MEKIKKAIILNGPGRSGTTLIYQILAYHEELSWISSWVNKFPNVPSLSLFNRIYTNKWFGINWHNFSLVPKPAEAYGFWKNYYGKSNNEVSLKEISAKQNLVVNRLKSVVKFSGTKKIFMTKITGHSRNTLLESLFENYQTIWIERDPRVVVSSYIKQMWFHKDRPKEFAALSEKEKIEFYCKYYLKIREEYKKTDNLILVRYEDLITDKELFFKNLCNQVGLVYTSMFSQIVANWPIKEIGWEFYKEKYSRDGIELLENLLKKELIDLGYFKK